MSSFSQRNMFDVLDIEDGPEYDEVVEEIPEEPQVLAADSAPLSKSAKKRAARAARLAAEALEKKSIDSAVNANSSSNDIIQPKSQPASSSEITSETKPAAATKAQDTPVAATNDSKETAAGKNGGETSEPAVISNKVGHNAATSRGDAGSASAKLGSSPPTSSFKPSLPADLPTRAVEELPANRKRKTPIDFVPSGPGTALTPTSPSKNSVKFEDGVLPGEGVEGERTITPRTEKKVDLQVAAVAPKKQNFIERTVWTFIMIFGFIGLLCMGHPYMIVLVLICQALVYKEVTALFDLRDHGVTPKGAEVKDPWSKTLNWYFFVVTNYFLYGESIIYYFKHIVFVDAYFIPFAKNHRFISFMLYVLGFVGFVANLDRRYLRQQFALFCWVHITLLIVVVSSHFIVNNILEGLIWFFVPASLVICNDVMAYVCGKLFGRTPLIKLSPKKTVEGFVGAFFLTLLFSLAWGSFFMRFPYMVCPAKDLGVNAWSNVSCKLNPVFVWRSFEFSGPLRALLTSILGREPPAIPYVPYQLHLLVMATFASLVAPFGGFFASGFKRAFNIKDFGHSIPGHGGMTDRMDCQFLMGLFAYVYYSSLIRIQNVTVGSIIQTVVTSLTLDEQVALMGDLKRYLVGQGVSV